ncbi:hypothetical protein M495_21755 [Serratia liquefaciens ATCC 27592]|nr:hypothetical protein M495_21755 [Serratia liquefaciens ATCC 27592]
MALSDRKNAGKRPFLGHGSLAEGDILLDAQ